MVLNTVVPGMTGCTDCPKPPVTLKVTPGGRPEMLPKSPKMLPALRIWIPSFGPGTKPFSRIRFRFPASVAVPETINWSYCVPAMGPASSMFSKPAPVCV